MVETKKLETGLRVVLDPVDTVRTISMGIFVKTGSRDENKITNGMAHFIEHMMFKGTEKRTAKDIADSMDRIGGQMNAFTAKEMTCYYVRILDTHFEMAFDILTDMFFNSTFPPEEITKEAQVVLEEINMYEDAPEDLIHDLIQTGVWEKHSLGYPILGTEETVLSFTQDNLHEFFDENYTMDNTVFSIVGNFDEALVMGSLEDKFGNFTTNLEERITEEVEYHPVSIKKEKEIEQLHITMTFPGFSMFDEEYFAVSAFNILFGGGMSSRLFQSIREDKGLVYNVASYNSAYSDAGLFNIYAALNPKNGEEAIRLMAEEIKKLETEPITEEQLDSAKEQLKSGIVMGLESTASRMTRVGRFELLYEKAYSVDEQMKKINAITLEDIEDVVSKLFDFKEMSLATVGKWDFDQEKLVNELRSL